MATGKLIAAAVMLLAVGAAVVLPAKKAEFTTRQDHSQCESTSGARAQAWHTCVKLPGETPFRWDKKRWQCTAVHDDKQLSDCSYVGSHTLGATSSTLPACPTGFGNAVDTTVTCDKCHGGTATVRDCTCSTTHTNGSATCTHGDDTQVFYLTFFEAVNAESETDQAAVTTSMETSYNSYIDARSTAAAAAVAGTTRKRVIKARVRSAAQTHVTLGNSDTTQTAVSAWSTATGHATIFPKAETMAASGHTWTKATASDTHHSAKFQSLFNDISKSIAGTIDFGNCESQITKEQVKVTVVPKTAFETLMTMTTAQAAAFDECTAIGLKIEIDFSSCNNAGQPGTGQTCNNKYGFIKVTVACKYVKSDKLSLLPDCTTALQATDSSAYVLGWGTTVPGPTTTCGTCGERQINSQLTTACANYDKDIDKAIRKAIATYRFRAVSVNINIPMTSSRL